MPLLTITMADVEPGHGFGSGITNVTQQISGALGLAVLSTVAASHTKELLAADHDPTSALIGGYHVAFLAGALTILTGIVLAFALLRPRPPRAELQLAERPVRTPTNLALKEQAA